MVSGWEQNGKSRLMVNIGNSVYLKQSVDALFGGAP